MLLAIGCFFIFILSLTILREIPKLDFIWNHFPVLMQLIPTWSFFAPIPNMFDYHLLYREIDNNGKVEDWKPVFSLDKERPFYCFLWHPEKKLSKAVLDISIDIIKFCDKVKDKKQICTSLPYLQILNHVDSLCKKKSKVQFVILTNSRASDYDIAFLSDVHPLSNR